MQPLARRLEPLGGGDDGIRRPRRFLRADPPGARDSQSRRFLWRRRRAIAGKLREKAVPSELIDRCLARLKEADVDVDETAAWSFAKRKRLGPFRSDDEQRRDKRQRDLAALARAGFGYSIAKRIIDAEELPDTV